MPDTTTVALAATFNSRAGDGAPPEPIGAIRWRVTPAPLTSAAT
ncbi:hypothetical protein PO883_19905 [Massilia sp. DJPM01]|nr:hypothetical protein [Massilia sp. DJPM01]MDM5179460.1 hypothetical protein [Massilia sp. DJPM01]